MSFAVIGVGGFVDEARRDADCKYVIARRKSPPDVVINSSMTELSAPMFSALDIIVSRADADALSRGVKRNFEQREANGSMILSSYEYRDQVKLKGTTYLVT